MNVKLIISHQFEQIKKLPLRADGSMNFLMSLMECGHWGSVLGGVFSCRWKSHGGAITTCNEMYCAW